MTESGKNKEVAVFLTVLLAFGFYFAFIWAGFFGANIKANSGENSALSLVSNGNKLKAAFSGISFDYPKGYALSESKTGVGKDAHRSIVLVEKTSNGKNASDNVPTETPVFIGVDIYAKNSYGSAERWIKESGDSNYRFSPDGKLYKDEIGGKEAVIYKWSGLYEAYSAVVRTEKGIYVFTVNYINLGDAIVGDFNALAETVEFSG